MSHMWELFKLELITKFIKSFKKLMLEKENIRP